MNKKSLEDMLDYDGRDLKLGDTIRFRMGDRYTICEDSEIGYFLKPEDPRHKPVILTQWEIWTRKAKRVNHR